MSKKYDDLKCETQSEDVKTGKELDEFNSRVELL